MLEARKHLVQYLHGLSNAKEYRSDFVQVESPEDIEHIITRIQNEHTHELAQRIPRTSGFRDEEMVS
jgi:tRNA-dihydrouridine synthase